MKNTLLLSALVSIFVSQAALAQSKPDGQWRGNFGAGASASNGTASSSSFNLAADMERATKADKMVFYGNMLYGSNKTAAGVKTTAANQATLGGRYEFNLTDRIYAYGMGELGRNHPNAAPNDGGDVKLRTTIGAGVGYHWVKTEKAAVDVFGGLGYTRTDYYRNVDQKGAELQLGEEGSYKISDGVALKQRIVFYPSLSDFSNKSRATADVGLSMAIANGWALNTSLGAKWYNAPNTKVETLFLIGVSTKFGAK
jgi:putative salt-induced outer membrane protein